MNFFEQRPSPLISQRIGLLIGGIIFFLIFLAIDMMMLSGIRQPKLDSYPLHRQYTRAKKDLKLTGGVVTFHEGFERTDPHVIRIALVNCGNSKLEQTIVTLKSAALTNTLEHSKRVHFIVMVDKNPARIAQMLLKEFPRQVLESISFEIHQASYPNMKSSLSKSWKNLFKPCASLRLFLPRLLPDIDALLYVDNDVIFLAPPSETYKYLLYMKSPKLAAMSQESQDLTTGWYNRFARHPFVPPLGVNSGVMLMNLTRFRASNWDSRLTPILKKYSMNLTWGDQDIINIYFSDNASLLQLLPCNYNYRQDFCIYKSVCPQGETSEVRRAIGGIKILHGSRDIFLKKRQESYATLYNSIKEFNWPSNTLKVETLEESPERIAAKKLFGNILERISNALERTGTFDELGTKELPGIICDTILHDTIRYSILNSVD